MSAESCNPNLEECYEIVTSYEYGPSNAAMSLGLIALTKALVPIILRNFVASS